MIFVHLFTSFFKIGAFSFGGGIPMLPLIFQSVQDFGNAATYVGFNYAGIPGALVATFAVCCPAFIIMLLVMKFLDKFKGNKYFDGAFYGIKPITVGLIGAAGVFVADSVLAKGTLITAQLFTDFAGYINIIPICIFAVTLILAGKFKLNPILMCIIAGIAGAFLCG